MENMELVEIKKYNMANKQELGFIDTHLRALSFIFKHHLYYFFLFPVVLFLLISFFGFELGSLGMDWIQSSIDTWVGSFTDSWIVQWIVKGIVWVLTTFILVFFIAMFGGFIVLVIMSPVLSILSEKTETIITGKDYPFSIMQIIKDVFRGLLLTLRNMGIEFLVIFLLMIFSIVPVLGFVIGLVSPVVIFMVSSYFYGFSNFYFSLERRKMSISSSVTYARKHKWKVMGNGAIFYGFMLIPFYGIFIASFVSIVSVVAATITVCDLEKESTILPT